jgi:hypothetical protein
MISTKNTEKALAELRSKTTNKVLTMSLAELHQNFNCKVDGTGVHFFHDKTHHIAVDAELPLHLAECTFVHECLHAILRVEGFPCAESDDQDITSENHLRSLSNITGNVTNAMHHPEIYKRMAADFQLRMDDYFGNVVKAKKNRFRKLRSNCQGGIEEIYLSQQNFLDAVEYFFYPPLFRDEIFSEFNSLFPENCSFMKAIRDKDLRYGSFKEAKASMESMLDRIRRYASKRGAEALNDQVWDRIFVP